MREFAAGAVHPGAGPALLSARLPIVTRECTTRRERQLLQDNMQQEAMDLATISPDGDRGLPLC